MQAALLEVLLQRLNWPALGNEQHLAFDLEQIGRAFDLGSAQEDILDVDHADHLVDIGLTQRIAGMASAVDSVEVIGPAFIQQQMVEVRSRYHDLHDRAPGHVEHVLQQVDLAGRERAVALRLGENHPQFFFGVGQLLDAGDVHAAQVQETVGAGVQQPQQRIKTQREEPKGQGSPERNLLGFADGQELGHQLAHDNVERGEDGKGQDKGKAVDNLR